MLSATFWCRHDVVENILGQPHRPQPTTEYASMEPSNPAHLPSGVLFGAAYYAEYHREERTELDLDLMQAAGFTVNRVGESVWSTWEPRDGEFDLDWLQPVLDGAHA